MADKTKSKPNLPRVFVYGTLKQGRPNHRALRDSDFLGRCFLTGPYAMLDLGWFPGVVQFDPSYKAPDTRILGEVYEVTDDVLHTLDIIEGHPNFYARSKVATPWKNAWCYFLPPAYAAKHKIVSEGIWNPQPDEIAFMHGVTA